MASPVWISWSGGKDCLMALARLRASGQWSVAGLICTINRAFDRVAMHGIRGEVLRAQAASLGLPLIEAVLDWPSSNEQYEASYVEAIARAQATVPFQHLAFGDLFLTDVRAYRERMLAPLGIEGVFPLWGADTRALARDFVRQGHRAMLTCVDTMQLDARFAGREFDATLFDELPDTVDPCGERGEFHTLSFAGPEFSAPLRLTRGESVLREERFAYTDFALAD